MALTKEERVVSQREACARYRKKNLAARQKADREYKALLRLERPEHLKEIHARWEDNHPEGARESMKKSGLKLRQSRKQAIISFMGGYKCKHCGATESSGKSKSLHFHHVDPSTKSFNVGQGMNKSLEVLIAEAKKCILLCTTCHAKEHRRLKSGYGRRPLV
jgi:5-methylcytosine-specific restriction endonuclease McrA